MTAPFLAPTRDAEFRFARAKTAGTTYYTVPNTTLNTISTSGTLTAGVDYYAPWQTFSPLLVDAMACEVAGAGGTSLRIGFYAADTSWQPVGPPRADSGVLDPSGTGVKTYTPGSPIYVPPGRYLSVLNCDSSSLNMRIYRSNLPVTLVSTFGASANNAIWRVTRAHAAFPTPGTAWDTVSATGGESAFHQVYYRISAL